MTVARTNGFVDRTEAEAARRALHDRETVQGLAEIFKVLGDATRLKVCLALTRHELCVGDLARVVGISESAASHQLRLMKALRLVRYRRKGRLTYYMLDDQHIEDLIKTGARHVGHG